MPSTGVRCEMAQESGTPCRDKGRTEYCGYCAAHWIELKDSDRAMLLERYAPDPPPPRPIVVEQKVLPVVERVRTVYPVRTRLELACLWLWRAGMSAAVVALIWKARHG